MSEPDPALETEGNDRAREHSLRMVSEEDATGRVAEIYDRIQSERDGELDEELRLNGLWLLLGNDPDLLEAVWQHTDQMYDGNEIPHELKSKISLVVATVMGCDGCTFFYEAALEEIGIDDEQIEGMKQLEITETGFSPSEAVVLKFTQKAAEDPHSITDEDLLALRELGLSERELLEIFDCIAFHVYTAVLQAISGIVYPGMDRREWTGEI